MKIIQNQTNEEPIRYVCATARRNDRTLDIFRNNNPLLALAEKLTKERDDYIEKYGNYATVAREKTDQSKRSGTALLKIIQKQELEMEDLKRKIEAKRAEQNNGRRPTVTRRASRRNSSIQN